jgi:hypothetical protein
MDEEPLPPMVARKLGVMVGVLAMNSAFLGTIAVPHLEGKPSRSL